MKKTFNLASKSIIFMFKSGTYIILFVFLFQSLVGQNTDVDFLKTKSNELISAGLEMNRDFQYVLSLDTFKLALEYRKKAYPDDRYYWGTTYLFIGITYKNLGRLDDAIKSYNLAKQCFDLHDNANRTNYATLYQSFGNVFRSKLDYTNALNYYSQALTIYQEQNREENIYSTYYSIAEIKHLMNLNNEALEILNSQYVYADTANQILYSELLGIIYQNKGNYTTAENYYEKAILLVKQYYGETDLNLAVEYLNYAEFLATMSKFDKGISTLEKAYEIISQTQKNKGVELAKYYEYKGRLYYSKPIASQNIVAFRQLRKQNLKEAIFWYNKSLEALFTGSGEPTIENITTNNSLSTTYNLSILKTIADTNYELATLDKNESDTAYIQSLTEALNYYNKISELIQRSRQEISGDENKIQLAQLEYETFTKTVKAASLIYELNQEDKYLELAFSNSEQIKSSAVYDKISTDLAQENSLIPDSLIELENKLNSTISYFNEKLFEENSLDEPDSALINEYNEKIFEANRQRDDLNRFLEEDYPDYYDLKYSKSMLGISDIQKKLHKKEAILEYVLNDSDSTLELYTFLITKEKKELIRQVITPEMEHSMEYIFNFMTTPNYIFLRNEDSKEFCLAAGDMYQLLVAPFNDDIKNKNLIIIPDGKLNYIAFDGLLESVPDTTQIIDFSKLDYLVRDFNVNYANSANILMKYRNPKRNMRNNILAFAPVYNSEQIELSNATYTLLPLPGVQKEVDAISDIVKTSVYRGKEASEENFRKFSQHFDILHLAMHAYINDSLPAFSRLAFSPEPGETDIQKDGWLNTSDIYNLDLKNVRLTVLSACNTGVGKMQKGEGLMSLARGFLYAGCPSIVMSLWEVEDNAGTQIMTSFYKNLKRGKTKDAALRAAKIEYLENANSRLAHPHYWMSFKCIGDSSPVYNSNDIYFFALLIVLILYFSIDQGIRIRKARRKRQAS